MKRILIRIGVVFFWIGLIFGILYWPDLPLEDKSINVFAWGDILEPSVIADFERQTGIKIHLNYFSSNEELIVKLKATEGEGYDLIIPSDYSVEMLVKEGLLKELDKSKMPFYANLNPMLLDHSFDPKNRYSVPFEWELFVLGIDKNYFKTHPLDPSWKMIFDPKVVDYQIAMINDPVEALMIGAFYLYGDVKTLTPKQLQEVTDLLIEQKKWVTAYADFRADYFIATKNCPVALASSSYILRTERNFDFVGFVVPKEGTFVSIENLCIPAASSKEEYVYELISYLYHPDSMAIHFNAFGFFPATVDVYPLLNLDPSIEALMSASSFKKYYFTKTIASQEAIRDAWVEIKSSGRG